MLQKDDERTEMLKNIRLIAYRFITQTDNSDPILEGHILKPKTYAEAVKAFLDADERLNDEKCATETKMNNWQAVLERCCVPYKEESDEEES